MSEDVQAAIERLMDYATVTTPTCTVIVADLRLVLQSLTASQAREREMEEALEPFAQVRLIAVPVVEICEPHPDNPSPNIVAFETRHFRRARQALEPKP